MPYIETRKLSNGRKCYRAQMQVDGERLPATFDGKSDARAWAEETRIAARTDVRFIQKLTNRTTVKVQSRATGAPRSPIPQTR